MTEKEENKNAEKSPESKRGERKKKEKKRASLWARRVGYIFAIFFTLIFMYIVNHLLDWRVPFLTDNFRICLWVINLSLAASILGNAILLAYDATWFRHIIQIILNVFSFVAVYVIYAVFPFAFPEATWALLARFVLIILMVGIGIGLIVEFVKLILNRD